jgi:hypothetical protein
MFIRNYLYELPDDIQASIYRIVFSRCLYDIDNDRGTKYMYRLYRAVNNPQNTCIYSILPLGMFSHEEGMEQHYKYYKYNRIIELDGFKKRRGNRVNGTGAIKDMIFLDRTHLLATTLHYQVNTISYYIYPLFTAKKTLKIYLGSQLKLLGYYDKEVIADIKVIDDRIDIVFSRYFKCNADIYYYILVGYNILYNSLSNIIYEEDNGILFIKFVEIFRWIEVNNVLEGYNLYNNKIIPIFEGKINKK